MKKRNIKQIKIKKLIEMIQKESGKKVYLKEIKTIDNPMVYFVQTGESRFDTFNEKEKMPLNDIGNSEEWDDSYVGRDIFSNISLHGKKRQNLLLVVKKALLKGKTLIVTFEEGVTVASIDRTKIMSVLKDASKKYRNGQYRDDVQSLLKGEKFKWSEPDNDYDDDYDAF